MVKAKTHTYRKQKIPLQDSQIFTDFEKKEGPPDESWDTLT